MILFSGKENSTPKTFTEYRKEKSKQWKGYTSKKKELVDKTKEVVISIGLMDWREKDCKLINKRGKKIPLRVSTSAKKQDIRIIAENKWKNYHPDLYNKDLCYTLLYESGQEIQTLPGSDEPFSLKRYQQEVGKDFKRITFFLCKENDLKISRIVEDQDIYGSSGSDSGPDSPVKRLKFWNNDDDSNKGI